MKLVINYDLIKEIQNAKEPFTFVKDIKNRPTYYISMEVLFTSMDLQSLNFSLLQSLLSNLIILDVGFVISKKIVSKICGYDVDPYREKAYNNLSHLVPQLSDLNVHTTYDLLLESEQYHKTHKIFLNENKLPSLLEKKYILVPTYDYLGEIQSTFILQEHVVGSKIYVLSLGSPTKEYRFAYSNS